MAMDKPSLKDFHLAMYSLYPGISFESCVELYLEQYPEKKELDPEPTQPKPKKKSKK
jgi:hypothetical protein